MGITYEKAPDIEKRAREIVARLGWEWIDLDNVAFIRSYGSASRGTIARCHALGKAMQIGMNRDTGFYLIEVISKNIIAIRDVFFKENDEVMLIFKGKKIWKFGKQWSSFTLYKSMNVDVNETYSLIEPYVEITKRVQYNYRKN